MDRWDFKYILIYAIIILSIILYSLSEIIIPVENYITQAYLKILFTVPILFVIAALLAFRISETSIGIVSVYLLLLSLPRLINNELLIDFLKILPFMLPFTLSLIFLIPEKIGKFSTAFIKLVLALLPSIFFIDPDYFKSMFIVPWYSIAAAFLPLAGPFIHRNRRAGTFSAALTSALILFILPETLVFDNLQRGTSILLAGVILIHSLYRVYWDNSYIDELTGLYNRRALDERFRKLRNNYVLSMVDVDHFKNFNDTYGHDEGDNVLRLVARILYTHFGKSAYRYGGEEFCVVFKREDLKKAAKEVDKARAAVEGHGFSIRRNNKNRKKSSRKKMPGTPKVVKLTVSAGVAAHGRATADAAEVLKNADKALYTAKEKGRNRVALSRIRN